MKAMITWNRKTGHFPVILQEDGSGRHFGGCCVNNYLSAVVRIFITFSAAGCPMI